MTYNELVAGLQTYLEIPIDDEDEEFTRALPRIIEYAENRIFREVSFLPTLNAVFDTLDINVREMELPARVLILRTINIYTPVGPITAASVRTQPERVSPEFLDAYWPEDGFNPGVPEKYTIIGETNIPTTQVQIQKLRWAPVPDASYNAEFLGTVRPMPISASNPATYLSSLYPDLLFAACMVGGCAYQRDFGSQADDPAKALSWEQTYQTLKTGSALEQARVSSEGPSWQPMPPAPIANASRAPE